MIKVMKRFGGAIMLYLVIFFGIVAISSRLDNIKEMGNNNLIVENR